MFKSTLILILAFLSFDLLGQAPAKMTYQAIARDNSGQLLNNQQVGMRFSILQGSTSGAVVFQETHTTTSTSNGLVSIFIGDGTLISGGLSSINWAAGPFFFKSEIDPNGGQNYSLVSTSQLMSVPYAMYAQFAANGPIGPQGPQGPQGPAGNGISNVTSNPNGSFTITYTNGNTFTSQSLTGPQGLPGPNGALVKSTAIAAGSNCSTGGVKLEFGQDSNNNGILDANEIDPTLTNFVCNGAQGPQGLAGPQGQQGIQGVPGPNGALIRSTVEPIGSNCPTGGIKLEFGQDTNNNGVLDASEINPTLTQFVCNGSQGPQGLAGPQGQQGIQGVPGPNGALIRSTVEPIGSNCPTGGIKLEFGQDTNNNGVLDASEINPTLTQFVCNGSQGPQGLIGPQGPQGIQGVPGPNGALVRSTVEPIGSNCPTGGIKLEFGQDTNNNGQLDANEINSSLTRYVCNGAAGAQGPAGPVGPTGTQGPQGNNGRNTVVRTTTLSPGSSCGFGGTRLEFGLDLNSNGTLDQAEVNAALTRDICNGFGAQPRWFLGKDTLGGIVFHLYQDANGQPRGLIVSKETTTARFQNTGSLTTGNSTWNGLSNTNLITNSPAKDWVQLEGPNWYLPSVDELNLLRQNRFFVNQALQNQGLSPLAIGSIFWSSTELSATNAYRVNFLTGATVSTGKTTNAPVLRIRQF